MAVECGGGRKERTGERGEKRRIRLRVGSGDVSGIDICRVCLPASSSSEVRDLLTFACTLPLSLRLFASTLPLPHYSLLAPADGQRVSLPFDYVVDVPIP